MPFFGAADMTPIEPAPGWRGRAVQCRLMTIVHYEIAADAAEVHEHRHPEEEAWNVIAGRLMISVDGEERSLGPGDIAVVPPEVPHRLRPEAASRALVVDSPARRQLPGGTHRP